MIPEPTVEDLRINLDEEYKWLELPTNYIHIDTVKATGRAIARRAEHERKLREVAERERDEARKLNDDYASVNLDLIEENNNLRRQLAAANERLRGACKQLADWERWEPATKIIALEEQCRTLHDQCKELRAEAERQKNLRALGEYSPD